MKLIGGINLHISVILILGAVSSCWAELRLLLSVFRHGDRYPIGYDLTKSFYPLNPHANANWFPDSAEGLTIAGKRRSFELGKILRERYGKWLGPIYSNALVEFHSSHTERAIDTASLVAAGLFPPTDSQRWNPHLNWQPIPIRPLPLKGNILYFGLFCSNYQALLENTKSTDPTIIKYDEGMQQFYDYVSKNTGAPVTNRVIYYIYLELLATVSGGLEPPNWTKGLFPEGKLKEAAMIEYLFSSWTDELKSFTGGVWLHKWLEHVDAYLMLDDQNNGVKKKAFFYGGHDVNIAGILTTLGIFYRHIPTYTSTINFELHEDDNRQFYVKVLHRDTDEFTERLVPGCGSILCPLETFRNIFAKVIPLNGTLDCGHFQY